MVLTSSAMLELDSPLPAFDLEDTVTGGRVLSSQFEGAPLVIAVICNHCPYVRHIQTGLVELGLYCQERSVAMVAVSANDPESHPSDAPEALAQEARRQGYTFPYLFDAEQSLVRDLHAVCTPEFYLFDRGHRLAYRGQLDDARPNNARPVTGADLKAAIERVIRGDVPSADQKPSIGCNIKWKPGNEPDSLR